MALFAIACGPATDSHAGQTEARGACTVVRVSDGDSLICRNEGRVRLLLIDAPEMAQGDAGRRARMALRSLAPAGTRLRVETDVRSHDQHRRLLAYLYLPDGRMLNEEMARTGFVTALVYPPNVKHVERIRNAVEEAQREGRGLWATNFFECSPRDYRAKRCGRPAAPAARSAK